MLKKLILPAHMKPDFIHDIQNMGKNGYDYSKTEEGLRKATRKMLEKSEKLKKE